MKTIREMLLDAYWAGESEAWRSEGLFGEEWVDDYIAKHGGHWAERDAAIARAEKAETECLRMRSQLSEAADLLFRARSWGLTIDEADKINELFDRRDALVAAIREEHPCKETSDGQA